MPLGAAPPSRLALFGRAGPVYVRMSGGENCATGYVISSGEACAMAGPQFGFPWVDGTSVISSNAARPAGCFWDSTTGQAFFNKLVDPDATTTIASDYGAFCIKGPPMPYPELCSTLRCYFSAYSLLCLMHAGKPTGVAVSHRITWFQTQLILTACQIRYHSLFWIIVERDSSQP